MDGTRVSHPIVEHCRAKLLPCVARAVVRVLYPSWFDHSYLRVFDVRALLRVQQHAFSQSTEKSLAKKQFIKYDVEHEPVSVPGGIILEHFHYFSKNTR